MCSNYRVHINVCKFYCTLIEPLCSISYKANRPISNDIGWLGEQTDHKFMIKVHGV